MIKAIFYILFKLPIDIMLFMLKLILLPFQLIYNIMFSSSKKMTTSYRKGNKNISTLHKGFSNGKNTSSSFYKEADLLGLSLNDRKIAKEERMSPSDYIEAEERDDDNLDDDD